jgi:hypothetical protein
VDEKVTRRHYEMVAMIKSVRKGRGGSGKTMRSIASVRRPLEAVVTLQQWTIRGEKADDGLRSRQ